MEYHSTLFFRMFLLCSAFFLSSCGGSSSSSGAINANNNHPQFFRNKITNSPSYDPSGETTDTTPTFSWKPIENATDYLIGHESTDTASTWHEYTITASESGCEQTGSTCNFTPSDFTFPLNVEEVWWVKAMVNGEWKDWSSPIVFTVIDGSGNNVSVPTPISPINNTLANSLDFSWEPVQGANMYMLGIEDTNTGENWQQEELSSPQSCLKKWGGICSYTFKTNNFSAGKDLSWWVKAKVNGDWGEWSEASVFTLTPNNSIVPSPIGPTGNINTIYPQFSWSSIVASEYRIAVEDADSGENHKVLEPISAKDAHCQTGQVCSFILKSPILTTDQNVVWWVQAKVNGEWGEWSDTGYFSIKFSSTNIPDEPYKYFCHNIRPNPPALGNLDDGVVINGKHYFNDPTDAHIIMVSNIDGTNEHVAATLPSTPHWVISTNGALFIKTNFSRIWKIRDNASPQKLAECSRHCPYGFSSVNNFTFYLSFRRTPRGEGYDYVRLSPSGDRTTLPIDNGTYFYEGNLYFRTFSSQNVKNIGKIDDSGELEYLTSCN